MVAWGVPEWWEVLWWGWQLMWGSRVVHEG